MKKILLNVIFLSAVSVVSCANHGWQWGGLKRRFVGCFSRSYFSGSAQRHHPQDIPLSASSVDLVKTESSSSVGSPFIDQWSFDNIALLENYNRLESICKKLYPEDWLHEMNSVWGRKHILQSIKATIVDKNNKEPKRSCAQDPVIDDTLKAIFIKSVHLLDRKREMEATFKESFKSVLEQRTESITVRLRRAAPRAGMAVVASAALYGACHFGIAQAFSDMFLHTVLPGIFQAGLAVTTSQPVVNQMMMTAGATVAMNQASSVVANLRSMFNNDFADAVPKKRQTVRNILEQLGLAINNDRLKSDLDEIFNEYDKAQCYVHYTDTQRAYKLFRQEFSQHVIDVATCLYNFSIRADRLQGMILAQNSNFHAQYKDLIQRNDALQQSYQDLLGKFDVLSKAQESSMQQVYSNFEPLTSQSALVMDQIRAVQAEIVALQGRLARVEGQALSQKKKRRKKAMQIPFPPAIVHNEIAPLASSIATVIPTADESVFGQGYLKREPPYQPKKRRAAEVVVKSPSKGEKHCFKLEAEDDRQLILAYNPLPSGLYSQSSLFTLPYGDVSRQQYSTPLLLVSEASNMSSVHRTLPQPQHLYAGIRRSNLGSSPLLKTLPNQIRTLGKVLL